MIIIIEGPDCAGKTSLSKHIQEQFKIKSFKESLSYSDRLKPEYDGFEHYKKLSTDFINANDHCVIDRFHIGEAVNPIIRKDGRRPLDVSCLQEIEDILVKKAILINCAPSKEFIEKTFKERGEDVAKKEDIQYLLYLYKLFFNISSLRTKYEFNLENDSQYKNIDSFLAPMFMIMR